MAVAKERRAEAIELRKEITEGLEDGFNHFTENDLTPWEIDFLESIDGWLDRKLFVPSEKQVESLRRIKGRVMGE